MLKNEVTLTGGQAHFDRALVCQHLMKICQLLAKGEDASGQALDAEGKHELVRSSGETQLVLLSFGMTSEEIADIVRRFSE